MQWEIVATDAATGAEQWRATPEAVLEANPDDDLIRAGVAALEVNATVMFFVPTHAGALYLERVEVKP
jgi:hypothetical protein